MAETRGAASRLAHRKTGSGPDVVFIHGWPLHGETFRHIVPRLESDFTCHVIDLPGTGQSEWDGATSFSIRAHAAAMLDAIQDLGLKEVAFVAHDSGGAVARLAAAELAERCFGLVLGNTEIPAYHPPMLEVFVRLARIPGGGSLLPLTLKVPALRRSFMGFGGCFDDKSLIDGEFYGLFVEPLLSSQRVLQGQLGLARDFDWSVLDNMAETHARIKAPVSLIWGVDDPWFPVGKARRMMPQFTGGAEFHEISPGKLFIHEEKPDIWAGHARRFLERAAARRPAA